MKTGIATISLRKFDLLHAIDLAAEAGFDCVELSLKPPHFPEEYDADLVRRAGEHAHRNGLSISMVGSYARASSPDFREQAEMGLKAARVLDSRLMRVWAGNREPHEADYDHRKQVAAELRELALRAEYQGVCIAVEMHSGTLCSIPEGAARLLEDVAVPNLKINFQVVDFIDPDLERAVGLLGEHIVCIHAQNKRPSVIDPGSLERCLISEGLVDYPHLIALLRERHYDGIIEVEFLKGENVSPEAMIDSMKRDAKYLRSII